MGDFDYSSRNVMLVYDPDKHEYKLAPNLDFEMSISRLNGDKFDLYYKEMFDAIKTKYPDVFNEFLIDLVKFKKDKKVISLINSCVKDEQHRKDYYFTLRNNARLILDHYTPIPTSYIGKLKQNVQDFILGK